MALREIISFRSRLSKGFRQINLLRIKLMRITVHVYGCNYVIFVLETCVPVTSFPKKNRERKSHHYKIKSTEKKSRKKTLSSMAPIETD